MDRLFDEEVIVRADYENFYLDDIFKQKDYAGLYGDMMSTVKNRISFLNKTMCGNGGTTGLIRYALQSNKRLLVLVPNVSICKSKQEDYKDNPDVCCVYGGVRDIRTDAQIVVATYDQFSSLLKKLSFSGVRTGTDIWDMSFWGGRTIVVDEYHKLIDDSGYRNVCHRITELLRKTISPVILMSATPNEDYIGMLRELLPERTIYNYTVRYPLCKSEYKTRIDIYEVKQKQLNTIFRKMKDSPNNSQVCVFYNSVSDIKKILGQIGDDSCEVLCSSNSREKVEKYYSEEFNPDKKLHFLTSAYFAGHDIWTPVDKCVIVGSGDRDNMCLGERDIRQIIGRFRMEGGGVRMDGVQLLYMKKQKCQANYMTNKNTFDNISKDMEMLGDRWMMLTDGIGKMHDLLRTKDALRRYDVWGSYGTLEKALTEYGYDVVKINMDFLRHLVLEDSRRHLTFKQAKERLDKGDEVDFDEYPDINELKAFIQVKGMAELKSKRTSKGDVHNWYKAYRMTRDKDLKKTSGPLYDAFGLQTFGRYNARFLKACLDFIDDEGDYDNMPAMMYEKMGCRCIPWKLDSKGHKQNNTWLVITDTPNIVGVRDGLLYNNEGEKPTNFGVSVTDTPISYEVSNNGRSCAVTRTIEELVKTGSISRLAGIPLYDWVNEDKALRLPEVKKDKRWTDMKRFRQSKISDMYKPTDKVYRFVRSEMNRADSLIIDIDGGLKFSEFQNMNTRWTWLAYPTISNVDEDWTKYRAIIPLARPIRLDGEHNLKVLKCLRTMFCPYEDPEHQVYSYINLDDFLLLKWNKGETYDIPQDFVDCLGMCITESYDYNRRKFDKKQVWTFQADGMMSLNDAKSVFLEALSDQKDGARHYSLFRIKKSLCSEDRNGFEDWLSKVYPHYLEHWRSHRLR